MKSTKSVTPHDSSHGHVSGQAEYIDDRLFTAGEVFVDVYYSAVAHARIRSVDCTEAAKIPEVLCLLTAKDLKVNVWGSIFHDQPLLADEVVRYVGEPLVVIAAKTREGLLKAKKAIRLDLQELEPVLSIDQAIAQKQFIAGTRTIARGDVDQALASAPHRLSGVIKIAGQDHFYLESQACIAYPKEEDQIEIHASSQHPSEVQHLVAEALGLKFHQVVCIVKRMGGGFGGKESQAGPFAVYAALVAQKLKRPARLVLGKDDDMQITGKRNPFQNHYEVGFDDQGKILALKAQLYSDGGAYADLSTAIMERAMLHSDNAYYIPHIEVKGQVCRTNTASNTAFRGFGGPKGMLMIENIIEDIARTLSIDAFDIRQKNVYQKGQKTHYGQTIEDDVLPELFKKVRQSSDYDNRRKEITAHNRRGEKTYRGLSVTAIKFGISFTTRFLNQASALVNVHMDGTAQVSTGATEMGQGVNTKIAQVVAEVFSIPASDVRVMPTSTEKNHNTSATAASSGSDLNGQAALKAALQIRERLSKVAKAVFDRPSSSRGRAVAGAGTVPEIDISTLPVVEMLFQDGQVIDGPNKISLRELIEEAYLNRVSLGAMDFYRYPGIHFNKETGQGQPFFYFTNGVAVSEVSIDRFTGEAKVLRSDVLMDLGRPTNEGIDMGQVLGAFVQGMGWMTTENLFYSGKGALLTYSPSTYKIPSVHDIPRDFRVDFWPRSTNEKNLKGSKAVGEPPLMLSISVWTAIKNAISSHPQGSGQNMSVPATQEKILLALNGLL